MARWQTFVWFSATLIVVLLLVLPSSVDDDEVSRPTSQDRGSFGLAAFSRWLAESNLVVHAQRQRFTAIADVPPAATGNLALVHLPATLIFEAQEIQALLGWVEAGNTLMLVTGHLEGSPWIYRGHDIARSLWRLTGVALELDDDEAASSESAETEPAGESVSPDDDGVLASIDSALSIPGWLLLHGSRTTAQLRPTHTHPLTDDLGNLEVPWDGARWVQSPASTATSAAPEPSAAPESPAENASVERRRAAQPWLADIGACASEQTRYPGQRLLRGQTGCLPIPTAQASAWQVLLTHRAGEQPALLEAPLGAGQLLLLLHPSLLGNEVIHRFDNRRFTMRLIDRYLGPAGSVIIDDAHQGLNDILEAADLLEDPRLYATIAFLLGFWVVFLLADAGHWRRAIFRDLRPAAGQLDLIRASANFLRHRLRRNATYAAMLEPLRAQLARKWRLASDEAFSHGLELERDSHPRDVERLEHSLRMIERGRKVPLLALHAQITNLGRAIA